MKIFKIKFLPPVFIFFPLVFSVLLFSCKTTGKPVPADITEVPGKIMGEGIISGERLETFFLEENPEADRDKLRRLIFFYKEECSYEGVNSDVAFAQMCLETGFLKFGGLVTPDMNNFCGLGSIGPGQPGNSFPDERTGVRAHVQHLKGYGSAEPLRGELVDPRYKWINPKGKSPEIAGLAGTWAADPEYGVKLEKLLTRMYGTDRAS